MIIGTDLKRSASNLKPTFSAATIFLSRNVSMNHRYRFEEVCLESKKKVLCSNRSLIVKRLLVVHDNQSVWWSVLMWRDLLRIWNKRFLRQSSSCGETSQCCPWQPKPRIIGTHLKRSASNLQPTISAATLFSWWHVSMLSMTTNALDDLYCFEEVCFELKTNGFCSNHSYCETSQCCPWKPNPMIICIDLKRSASNLITTVSAATILWFWNVSMVSMTTNTYDHRYWVEKVCFESETNNFCNNYFLDVKRFNVVHDSQTTW